MNIAAVILAAGMSRRLGEPKQLLRDQHGELLVHKVAREAADAGLNPVVVVVGAYADEVRAAVQDLDVIIEENARWADGISTSIRAGIAAVMEANPILPDDVVDLGTDFTDEQGNSMLNVVTTRIRYGGVEAALLLTTDMPTVDKGHLRKLTAAFGSASRRVASQYGNTVGIPAIIAAIDFESLQSLYGDSGAKALFRSEGTVLVPLEGGDFDLDTPADVAKWRAASGDET